MGLLNALRKSENVRRLFGKRELIIIEKQLLGVSLTQSEKNRLSRDIRKKFKAIRELIPAEGEFELKKGAEIKRLIEEAKEIIFESKYFPRVKKIILFGSVIANKLTLSSDIDIAAEFSQITKKEATRFRIEIAGRVSDKVDIQVYNILPEKLKKEIDEKGKRIYERQNQG